MAQFGELNAISFHLGEVHVAHWIVVAFGQLVSERTRKLPHDALPFTLRRFVLGHPKAFGQYHFDLIFTWTAFGLGAGAAHDERAWGTPAEFNAKDFALVACFRAGERC